MYSIQFQKNKNHQHLDFWVYFTPFLGLKLPKSEIYSFHDFVLLFLNVMLEYNVKNVNIYDFMLNKHILSQAASWTSGILFFLPLLVVAMETGNNIFLIFHSILIDPICIHILVCQGLRPRTPGLENMQKTVENRSKWPKIGRLPTLSVSMEKFRVSADIQKVDTWSTTSGHHMVQISGKSLEPFFRAPKRALFAAFGQLGPQSSK